MTGIYMIRVTNDSISPAATTSRQSSLARSTRRTAVSGAWNSLAVERDAKIEAGYRSFLWTNFFPHTTCVSRNCCVSLSIFRRMDLRLIDLQRKSFFQHRLFFGSETMLRKSLLDATSSKIPLSISRSYRLTREIRKRECILMSYHH